MNHLDLYPDDTTNKEIVIVGGGAVGLDVAEYFANESQPFARNALTIHDAL